MTPRSGIVGMIFIKYTVFCFNVMPFWMLKQKIRIRHRLYTLISKHLILGQRNVKLNKLFEPSAQQKDTTLYITSSAALGSTWFRRVGELCFVLHNKMWEASADSDPSVGSGGFMNFNASSIWTFTSTQPTRIQWEVLQITPLTHKHWYS